MTDTFGLDSVDQRFHWWVLNFAESATTNLTCTSNKPTNRFLGWLSVIGVATYHIDRVMVLIISRCCHSFFEWATQVDCVRVRRGDPFLLLVLRTSLLEVWPDAQLQLKVFSLLPLLFQQLLLLFLLDLFSELNRDLLLLFFSLSIKNVFLVSAREYTALFLEGDIDTTFNDASSCHYCRKVHLCLHGRVHCHVWIDCVLLIGRDMFDLLWLQRCRFKTAANCVRLLVIIGLHLFVQARLRQLLILLKSVAG